MKTVAVENAPKAIGPYSQGAVAGGFLFTAGQIPLDPSTMTLIEGDIGVLTNRVIDNLEAVLAGAGCRLTDVVKSTVFLIDLAEFAGMNEVYGRRFGDHRPARSTIQVAKLPAGARVEIEIVAKLPG